MRKSLLALTCSLCLCAGLALPASAAFADVTPGAWYEEAVEEAVAQGYMTGVDAVHFAPDAPLTRASLVTVLWRMAGSPANDGVSFSDVSPDAWYAQAVAWAKGGAIANGGDDGTFRPNATLTREELAVFLTRYDRNQGTALATGALNLYSDAADIAPWAVDGMAHALGMGWLEGSDGKISPQGTASRAQLAVILQRMTTQAMG